MSKQENIVVKLTFTQRLLASSPNNPSILEDHLKAPLESALKEEQEAIKKAADRSKKATEDLAEADEEYKKMITVFPTDDKGLFLWNYQSRGFLKEQLFKLIELGDCPLSRWSYKKAVDSFVLPHHRRNYYTRPDGSVITKPDGIFERPARVDTRQGERVCIVASEYIDPPAELIFGFTLLVTSNPKNRLAVIDHDMIVQCMVLGSAAGFGQWRSGGFGEFTWEEVEQAGNDKASE